MITFTVGVVIGCVITAFWLFNYYYKGNAEQFVNERLKLEEKTSSQAFIHLLPEASRFVQTNYLIFLNDAYKIGLINDNDFHRTAASANTRMCINYEDDGATKTAEQICSIAREHLAGWNSKLDFEEFKSKYYEVRSKKSDLDNSK